MVQDIQMVASHTDKTWIKRELGQERSAKRCYDKKAYPTCQILLSQVSEVYVKFYATLV